MATSDDNMPRGDLNTASLKSINDFYGTAYTDVNAAIQRFLRDNSATTPAGVAGTANDSTRAWNLLLRFAQGTTS